jgi:hypothetical protein
VAVVARFRDLPGAEVASASLDAAGIGNDLSDAYTVGLLWTYSTALGWIRLSVDDPDVETARKVLEPAEIVEWPIELEPGGTEERCPACDSSDLAIEKGARKTLALWLLTNIPIWFWRSKLRCRACGVFQVVPLRFRPDLAGAWLIAAIAIYLLSVGVFFLAGYMIYGRA